MRSMWKGAISFGLVAIPIKLYSATQENDLSFHQVHRTDGARVRYKRVCSADGEEVAYADIAKGYELPTGETVVLTDDDLAELPLPTQRTIEVLRFVPLAEVDPLYFAKSYYLEPERTGTKPYVLLRRALTDSGMVALVKVALRQRESLATLRVVDDVLVLETMLWPDEIRTPDFPFLDEDVEVRDQELKMAASLIDSLSGPFEPQEYTDGYREALEAVIEAKVEGRDVVSRPDREEPAQVLDLMAALRASVARARGEQPSDAKDDAAQDASSEAAPAKKSAATKSSATKSTAKDSAAKKGAATMDSAAKKAAAKKGAATRAAAKKGAATRAAAKKGAATKAAAKKGTATEPGAAKKPSAKKTAAGAASVATSTPDKPAKKAPAKRTRRAS